MLCQDPSVTAAVLKSMLEEGRAAKLRGFEQVLIVHHAFQCSHCGISMLKRLSISTLGAATNPLSISRWQMPDNWPILLQASVISRHHVRARCRPVLDSPISMMLHACIVEVASVSKSACAVQVAAVTLTPEPFSVENGLLTPTFKLKRPQAKAAFQDAIKGMYSHLAT